MLQPRLKTSLVCIVVWIAGCTLWSVAGVMPVAATGTGIGPTASLGVAGILAVMAVLLYLAARFDGLVFAALSALCAVAGFAPVYQAVTGDASLWPTPFWRWAGAALNLCGIVAGLLGVTSGFRSRRITAGANTQNLR